MNNYSKLPRLYIDQPLKSEATITLEAAQTHYFKTVLRRQEGDQTRIFNGKDGEYTATIVNLGKKDGTLKLETLIKPQPENTPRVHLFFAPIKKQRLDILIEKAVELGATDLHPVITARTELRKLNEDRIKAQIIEAAEQCERMEIPVLHDSMDLKSLLAKPLAVKTLFWCNERGQDQHIANLKSQDWAFLIGPEGGFDDNESQLLAKTPGITPISLGDIVYRAETAALVCLAHAANYQKT